MARALKDATITTAKARERLLDGVYWRRLDAEAHVGYRKGKSGGVWLARWRNRQGGAAYKQARIGTANDLNDKIVEAKLNFDQATRKAHEQVARARGEAAAKAAGPTMTVGSAVEEYIAHRDARDARRQGRPVRSDAGSRLRRYVIGAEARGRRDARRPTTLAEVPLHLLVESDLINWQSALPEALKASTRQRLLNDLKAALNAAYLGNRQRLEATLLSVVKYGLRFSSDLGDELVPVARENQILSDAQVGRVIAAARDIDSEHEWEGDLYRAVVVLAATGARFSQIIRMRVDDCQPQHGRVLVPASRKGNGKSGSISVPVGEDVLKALETIATGRSGTAPLLERWRHEQMETQGSVKFHWRRKERGPWQAAAELTRPWRAIRARADMPNVIPYALRHSSIVRGIRANLPIRLVAALHDTSTEMIERHYSRWIVDGLDELAARAVVSLVPAES